MMPKYTHLQTAFIVAILISALLLSNPVRAETPTPNSGSTAVIFLYQRVGEDNVPQSNISVEQFREHLNELKKNNYSVLPLEKIIDTLKSGGTLPSKTVGITFEGAYQTTLSKVLPLLEERNFPFTVFISSDMAEGGTPSHMTWDQIKQLKNNSLVSLGLLPSAYVHMLNQKPEENLSIINKAVSKYREALDEEPSFFAYPYGEFNSSLKKQLLPYKFKAVFGLHSGAIDTHSDFLALPRFAMTDNHGDIDRFMITASAIPLPVSDVIPDDAGITQNPPVIGFTVAAEIGDLSKLSCFASSLGKLPLTRIGGNRIEIRLEKPFTDRRTRINCTLPSSSVLKPGTPQVWRWFGMMLTSPAITEESPDDAAEDGEDTDTPKDQ